MIAEFHGVDVLAVLFWQRTTGSFHTYTHTKVHVHLVHCSWATCTTAFCSCSTSIFSAKNAG